MSRFQRQLLLSNACCGMKSYPNPVFEWFVVSTYIKPHLSYESHTLLISVDVLVGPSPLPVVFRSWFFEVCVILYLCLMTVTYYSLSIIFLRQRETVLFDISPNITKYHLYHRNHLHPHSRPLWTFSPLHPAIPLNPWERDDP